MNFKDYIWIFQGLTVNFSSELIKYLYNKFFNRPKFSKRNDSFKKKYYGDFFTLYLNVGVMCILIYIYLVAFIKHMSEFDIMNVNKNMEFFIPFFVLSLYPLFSIKIVIEDIKKNYH